MIESLAKFSLDSWSVPEIPVKIEYSREVMEEVRGFVCDELQQLSHGGLEAAGVLFGRRKEGSIRIQTWRPFSREASTEPSAGLSARDRVAMVRLMAIAEVDPDLKDLTPLGWFASHAHTGVSLTVADVELYKGFFPDPWQVTLALHLEETGRVHAGFFARDGEGKLKQDSSYKEFVLDPTRHGAAPSRPSPPHPDTLPTPGVDQVKLVPDAPASYMEPMETPSFQLGEDSFGGSRWLWIFPILLVVAVIVFLQHQRPAPPSNSPPFSLRVAGDTSNIEISWDRDSAAVRSADHARVKIQDGPNPSEIALTVDQLRSGGMLYAHHTAEVGIEMTLYSARGGEAHEFARFVTQTPRAGSSEPGKESLDASQSRIERLELENQITGLKEEVRKEKTRADRLQDVVRILQKRLGVEAGSEKK